MKEIHKAMVEKDGKLLILRRSSYTNSFPGYWDFPGGELESGETPSESLKREVKEETGLEVQPLEAIGTYRLALEEDSEEISHIFTVHSTKLISDREVELSHEHTDFRWAEREDILKLDIEPFMENYFEEHS